MYTVNSFTPFAAEVNIACCMTVCSWSDNGFFTLRAVKDWVLCILNIKIEYFVCRFLGHVLILLLDVIYENILPSTSI